LVIVQWGKVSVSRPTIPLGD